MKEKQSTVKRWTWLARDKDGSLWLYFGEKPKLNRMNPDCYYNGGYSVKLEGIHDRRVVHPKLEYEDGPIRVDVKIFAKYSENGSLIKTIGENEGK